MPDNAYPTGKKKFPKVLAFDTTGPYVSVGGTTQGYSGGTVHEMARGQAEFLFGAIEDYMNTCHWDWPDLDAIGVAVGPGNFTGIRIAVSAARGLGLALGIPVFAISQFEAAYGSAPVSSGMLISVPAPRDMAYVQGFGTGPLAGQALLIDPADPPRDLQLSFGMQVLGHRASDIAAPFDASAHDVAYTPDPGKLAEIAEAKYLAADTFPPRPAPLYVKPPDAAPARDTPPVILP